MSEAKPFASLSSALLARKGHAKPAMRPQAFQLPQNYPADPQHFEHDDLGWNDMGQDHASAEPVALHGAPVSAPTEPPAVVAQHEQLTREFPEPEMALSIQQPATAADIIPIATPVTLAVPAPTFTPAPRAAAGSKAKAAFTLRLDADRHLRLRMLSAVSHRSAQQIVTQALDEFLDRRSGSSGPTFQTKISSGDNQ